jgi:hypothetical protein
MNDNLPTRKAQEPLDALDHAQEFVEVVLQRAPSLYRELLETPVVCQRLSGSRPFNHGKLYAWAEFVVFRAEFLQRFPDASPAVCINAFSRLLLKNDISITNLATVMEASAEAELARLS